MTDYTGQWFSSFGPMTLIQSGDEVTGQYGRSDPRNTLRGTCRTGRLFFEYAEPAEQGTGWFELTRDGRFTGEYVPNGASTPRPWTGNRGFDGIWNTKFGSMRLIQSAGRVRGLLDHGAPFNGEIIDGRLVSQDFVPGAKGEAIIELGPGDLELRGRWNAAEGAGTVEIAGHRQVPEPRGAWLIVLEAHWQRSLAEREFAFGDMLDEIFARLPHVNVRHRYFDNEDSLVHWCSTLQFLAEPVVLVVTSHGEPQGLMVRGQLIDSRKVIDSLQGADSLRLVHFSSCLIANGGETSLANAAFPVSGYTSSVDWMASALTEFTYLDMILSKGLTPEAAAAQVYRLIGFAGAEVPEGCPYPAAGFQLIARAPRDPAAGLAIAGATEGVAGTGGTGSPSIVTAATVGVFGTGRGILDKLDGLRRKLTDRA